MVDLGKNGKAPSTKRTRHIVTDRVKASGSRLDTQHCPTEGMSADLLTKPLQGSLPREHRGSNMGVSASEFDNYWGSYNAARGDRGTPAGVDGYLLLPPGANATQHRSVGAHQIAKRM